MSFPYSGTMGIASVVYDQCSSLARKYFRGAINAPENYRLLGAEVRKLNNILEILCVHRTSGELEAPSLSLLDEAHKAARESIEELERFLERHHGIENADKQWWREFAGKVRFVEEVKRIKILKAEFSSHVQALEVLRSDMQQ